MTRTTATLSFRAKRGVSLLLFSPFLLFAALPASAQVATGTPPFGSFAGGPEVINLGNNNTHLAIPVLRKPGRGSNFTYDLSYDSSVWYPVTSGSTTTWTPVVNWGWTGTTPTTTGYATYKATVHTCRFLQETQWITEQYTLYSSWAYVDSFGVTHAMSAASVSDGGAPDCGPNFSSATVQAFDGSGYKLSVDGGPDATVYTPAGAVGSVTLQTKHTTKYNTLGGPTETDDYAFGSGTFGGLLRQTLITYASLGNITAFRQTVTVKNGTGAVLAQTNYNYDQTTPVNAPTGTPQLTSVSGSRGNLTSVQKCTVLTNCSSYLQTTMTYDTAGQRQTVKDPANNQTSFSYDLPPSFAHGIIRHPKL